ncbi:class I SAM-dependent methyltransferase [Staphylococcus cohnii]|uniref:hypothetical protein n=1 Tax=Staphylococcus cohnii TaxID=29382 RepID=UPI003829D5B4
MNKYIIFITSTVLKFVLIAVLSLNLTKLTNRTNFIFVFLYVLNVTWLLPDTKAAYQEWLRVLKPNATLINIDGDYGKDAFTDYSNLPNHHAHHALENTMLAESENIKQSISINHYSRPQYDLNILKQINTKSIHVDTTIYQRIYQTQYEFYNPTPIFLIALTK